MSAAQPCVSKPIPVAHHGARITYPHIQCIVPLHALAELHARVAEHGGQEADDGGCPWLDEARSGGDGGEACLLKGRACAVTRPV